MPRPVDTAGVDLRPACWRGITHNGGTAQVFHIVQSTALTHGMGQLNQSPFGVTVQQNISAGINQYRAAYLIAPVIVLGDTAQTGFNTANHNRYVFVGFTAFLRINDHRTVRALTWLTMRGVGIIRTDFQIRGVFVDQRVHVAGGDTEIQIRLTQLHKVVRVVPVRLSDDTHAKALGFQQTAQHRHTKARMIHIGVATDDDHITAVPAKHIHFLARHGQKRRSAEAFSPVGIVRKQMGSLRIHG